MKIPKSVGKLTKLFETLGAPDPESWARSKIDEDVLEMNPTSREMCPRDSQRA